MDLVSLDIRNFRVIKTARVVFPDRVIGIIGPNGAGKSTLIEAVAWVLYGNQAARTGRDEIKSAYAAPADNCEVVLSFRIRGEGYRVFRRLVGRTQRAEVGLHRGEVSAAVGINETQQYIERLLGLDWRGFLTSFLARQQELNALSDLQPARRRDHLVGMLGIERLDRAISRVKADTRVHLEQAGFLERRLRESEHIETRIPQLERLEADLAKAVVDRESQMQSTAARLKQEIARNDELQKARSTWLELRAKLASERASLADRERQLESLRKDEKALERSRVRMVELEPRLKRLEPCRAELTALSEAKGRVELRRSLHSQVTALSDDINRTTRDLAGLESLARELGEQLSKTHPDIETSVEEVENQLEQAREEFAVARGELRTAQAELEKLERQMRSIEDFGPESVCDRCLRPLGDDLPRIRQHLQQEHRQMQQQVQEGAGVVDRLTAGGEKLKQQHADLRDRRERHRRRLTELDSVKDRLRQMKDHRSELVAKREAAASQAADLEKVVYDHDRFTAVETELRGLEMTRSEYDELKGGLGRLDSTKAEIHEWDAKAARSRQVVEEYDRELSGLAYDEAEFEAGARALAEAREQAQRAREAFLEATKEHQLRSQELSALREQRTQLTRDREELETCRTSQFYGEKLATLFADFRQHLVTRIRPTLSEISGRLMAEMTDGRYNMVELDEKYNLRVMDYGRYYDVERFSGGEKDLANLCLRLAISQALTESAGLERSFIILDEVFASQDLQRKDLILAALANLKGRFHQILLVTHVEDVKEQVEELIEIRPSDAGWSQVIQNGSPV